MEEVDKDCRPWPHLAHKITPDIVRVLDEDVKVLASSEGRVSAISDPCVHNGDIVRAIRMNFRDELAKLSMGEAIGVKCPVHVGIHVVNIIPYSIQRDIMRAIAFIGSLGLVECPVPPAALMPSQRPLRREGWMAYCLVILMNDGMRCRSCEEEYIEHAAYCPKRHRVRFLIEDDIHCI